MSGADLPIGRIALRGGVVAGGAQVVKMGVQAASIIVLARLLRPADFGLMAAVAPVVGFAGLVQGMGLYEAVIQRPSIGVEEIDRVFWMTVAAGLVSGALVLAASPAVAWFYDEPRLLALCAASAGTVVVWSLSTVPTVLINRRFGFAALAATEAAASVAGLLAGWTAARAGAGVWALLIGTLGSALTTVGGVWWASGWRPGWAGWGMPDRALLRFGGNLTGFNILNFVARNLDNLVIGRAGGVVQLGLYDRGGRVVQIAHQAVSTPLAQVMVPVLSRVAGDAARLRAAYLGAVTVLTLLTVPGMAALAATSDAVAVLLFGAGWQGVGPILFWLAVSGMVLPLNASTGWLLIAQGRTAAMLRMSVFNAVVGASALLAGARWGAVGVAAAYAAGDYLVRVPVLYAVVARGGAVSVGDLVGVQGPVLLTGAAVIGLVRGGWLDGAAGVGRIVAAVAVAYGLSGLVVLLLPGHRRRVWAMWQ